MAESPYKLNGRLYHELCYCPESTMSRWLNNMHCADHYTQIDTDLSVFNEIDMSWVRQQMMLRFNRSTQYSLCHYVIQDNQIYRKTFGQHTGFKMFSDNILLSLARKVRLPDMEFFVNLGDWPLENKPSTENPLPILSWCGSQETRDIVMPTYDITESTLEAMSRVSLDMLSVQANTGPSWNNKSHRAFWLGRDSRQERLDLVKLSRKYPEIIDAKLTNMFFFKHSPDLGEITKSISFFDFFQHRYQINIDGTVAAYRLPYLLAGDAVVLKQESKYYEHFYQQLQPYVHYIPFRRDLSDLLQQIAWAKEHDLLAQQIAKNGQKFARDNLLAKDIFCYHGILLQQCAKRLTQSAVQVYADMELVPQPNDRDAQCVCDIHKLTHNEL